MTAGYLVSPKCVLCGHHADDVMHRIWRCSHSQEERAEHAEACGHLERLMQAGGEKEAWARMAATRGVTPARPSSSDAQAAALLWTWP